MATNVAQPGPLLALINRQKVVDEPAYLIDKSIMKPLVEVIKALSKGYEPNDPERKILASFIDLVESAEKTEQNGSVPKEA